MDNDFLFIHINLITSQSTVHLQSTEEGRGIVKSRGNECFIIAPDHLFPRKSSEKVIVSGDNQKISRGKYIQSYPADIAIVRIESGADQECKEWKTVQNYNSLLEKTNEGYIEIRNDDGSYDHEPMYLKSKSMSGITISPKDNSFEFSKGMSGSSLFTNLNDEKVYLGMLLSVDEENSQSGNVFQADDMERIMQEFFKMKIVKQILN
ncbi:MAG: hypothetical protein IPO92_18770 [Saprospiraceae bacterium]|nr:hypothetical protein [Saprospiraceae bacterium]